jgi:hypothetical protein
VTAARVDEVGVFIAIDGSSMPCKIGPRYVFLCTGSSVELPGEASLAPVAFEKRARRRSDGAAA